MMLTKAQKDWLLTALGINVDFPEVEIEGQAAGGMLRREIGADYAHEEKQRGWRSHAKPAPGESREDFARRINRDANPGETPEQTAARHAALDTQRVLDQDETTRHYTEAETEANRFRAGADGNMRSADGTVVSGRGGDFVMDPKDGSLVLSDMRSPQDGKYTHHSSMLRGADVAVAGGVSIEDGKVTHVSNNSGHYKPRFEHLLQAVEQLIASGAMLDTTLVDQHGQENPVARLLADKIAELPKVQTRLRALQAAQAAGKATDEQVAQEIEARERQVGLIQKGIKQLRKIGYGAANRVTGAVTFVDGEGTAGGGEFKAAGASNRSADEFTRGTNAVPLPKSDARNQAWPKSNEEQYGRYVTDGPTDVEEPPKPPPRPAPDTSAAAAAAVPTSVSPPSGAAASSGHAAGGSQPERAPAASQGGGEIRQPTLLASQDDDGPVGRESHSNSYRVGLDSADDGPLPAATGSGAPPAGGALSGSQGGGETPRATLLASQDDDGPVHRDPRSNNYTVDINSVDDGPLPAATGSGAPPAGGALSASQGSDADLSSSGWSQSSDDDDLGGSDWADDNEEDQHADPTSLLASQSGDEEDRRNLLASQDTIPAHKVPPGPASAATAPPPPSSAYAPPPAPPKGGYAQDLSGAAAAAPPTHAATAPPQPPPPSGSGAAAAAAAGPEASPDADADLSPKERKLKELREPGRKAPRVRDATAKTAMQEELQRVAAARKLRPEDREGAARGDVVERMFEHKGKDKPELHSEPGKFDAEKWKRKAADLSEELEKFGTIDDPDKLPGAAAAGDDEPPAKPPTGSRARFEDSDPAEARRRAERAARGDDPDA